MTDGSLDRAELGRVPRSGGAEDIIPRDIRFDIPGNAQRHWFGGDPYRSAVIDNLSLFLPEGERFFIRSLKHYAASLEDRGLADEINGYAMQEAFHTREHEEYNRALSELGYPVAEMEKPIRETLRSITTPVIRLAATCAIEHITAIVSKVTLERPDLFEDAAPAYRRLWMWHALEELEHKAVAMDVYAMATRGMPAWKRYLLRVSAMNGTAIGFIVMTLRNIRLYARRDGIGTGPLFWLKLLKVLFISPGWWRMTIIPFLRYYLPGFDPRAVDDAHLIRRGRDWLAAEFSGPAGAAYRNPA